MEEVPTSDDAAAALRAILSSSGWSAGSPDFDALPEALKAAVTAATAAVAPPPPPAVDEKSADSGSDSDSSSDDDSDV